LRYDLRYGWRCPAVAWHRNMFAMDTTAEGLPLLNRDGHLRRALDCARSARHNDNVVLRLHLLVAASSSTSGLNGDKPKEKTAPQPELTSPLFRHSPAEPD